MQNTKQMSARQACGWLAVIGFGLTMCAPGAEAATQVPALKSPWIYYEAYAIPQSATACLPTDQAMAEAMIERMRIESNMCMAQFDQWTSAWPNGEGRTDWRQLCPPSGIQVTWGFQHREVRQYQFAYKPSYCPSTVSYSGHSIERHFFYYCSDPANYELFQPPYSPGPMIPACRLKAGKADPDKQPRDSCPEQGHPCVGNPIDVATGNKFQRETDYLGDGLSPLLFARHYNSIGGGNGSLGANWSHTYNRRIERISLTAAFSVARAHRPDGRVITYDDSTGTWQAQPDIAARLTRTLSPLGWVYKDESDTVETYDDSGRLLSIATRAGAVTTLTYDTGGALAAVTDSHGKQLSFTYDTSGRIHVMTVPGGGTYVYEYDAANDLTSVTAPDLAVRTYVYNESSLTSGANLPHALTGIVDENNQRFATWKYDSSGRAIR